MTDVTIIDYGLGNLESIANMVKKVGGTAVIAHSVHEIQLARKLILPGVGAFDHGMKLLGKKGIIPILRKKVFSDNVPCLGICLGAQLMTDMSEEGTHAGLGWIHGTTKKFISEKIYPLKIPHVGWNTIRIRRRCPLLKNMKSGSRFYFTHSYYIEVSSKKDIVATTEYGREFVSVFNRENLYGVQFHPEKSHIFGMTLIRNFLDIQ